MVIIEIGKGDLWAKAKEKQQIKERDDILNGEKFARDVAQPIRFTWMQLYYILIRFEIAKQIDAKAKALAAKNANVVYLGPEEDWNYHDGTGVQAMRAIEVLAKEYPSLAKVVDWARISNLGIDSK